MRPVSVSTRPASAWLGAAVLGYRNADREAAESLLAHALEADRGLKADIDVVLTRGRHDRRDPRGYELVQGQFVSATNKCWLGESSATILKPNDKSRFKLTSSQRIINHGEVRGNRLCRLIPISRILA